MILNIGCGRNIRKDCINVDITKYEGVDEAVDLSSYQWKWEDNSIDGIYASHVIEHLPNQEQFILECYRILKPGGFLRLNLPHASSVTAIGCMGHYRTYSYNTMKDYLSRDFYMFGKAKFKTVEQRFNWWYEKIDLQNELPKWTYSIIKAVDFVISVVANKFPRLFENIICPTIQMREVIWKGEKI